MRASAVTTRQHGGRSAAGSRHTQFSQQQQAGALGASRHPCCHAPPAAAAATTQRQHLLTTNSSSSSSHSGVTAMPPAPTAAAVANVSAASAAVAAAAPAAAEAAAATLQLTSAQADAALRLVHLQRMGSHLERAYLLQQPLPNTQQQQQPLGDTQQQQQSGVTPQQQQSGVTAQQQTHQQQLAPVGQVGQVPAPAAAAVAAAGPAHQWGQGLSVGQFTAALQALPMQQRVRWKSVYPAIGSGARGKVYQAINLDTGGMLAVKVVSLQHLMGPGPEAALRREALVLELAAMQDYTHPHLLAMQGFCFRSGSSKPRLEIFSELGCCLEDIMPDEGEAALQLGLVQKVMAALLGALDFLHGRGVVHRDVKPGNVVSVGAAGTFKLIDMDSVFHTQTWDEEDEEEEGESKEGPSAGGQGSATALALDQGGQEQGEEGTTQQQQQQPLQQQQQLRRSVGVAPGGGMGTPCPASLSAHLAAGAAGRQQQQQQQQQQKQQQDQQQQQGDVSAGALTALSFAGTPDNMAPEAAPTVVRLPLVLWDLFPLRAGEQVASSAAVAPAQDIWSSGTVLYELLTGRSLFSGLETPEALYQHLCALRGNGQAVVLPGLPQGLDRDVVEVLEACLQVDPAARPTAKQLLEMEFFNKSY